MTRPSTYKQSQNYKNYLSDEIVPCITDWTKPAGGLKGNAREFSQVLENNFEKQTNEFQKWTCPEKSMQYEHDLINPFTRMSVEM